MRIILASKSSRRKSILKNIGLKFKTLESRVDESQFVGLSPLDFVKRASLKKAEAVLVNHPKALIIAADTIVVFRNEIIGKPKDKKNAEEILKKLSGKTHLVITGFTILSQKKIVTKTVESKVTFRKLSSEEIKGYVKTGEPMDKAGGYGIQDRASVFIEKVEGDFFNVVGLPVFELIKQIERFGVKIPSFWN